MIEHEEQAQKINPLFYFRYQMRIQFIPFIEQEIEQFISFSQKIIEDPKNIKQVLVILNKRIKDIDLFYKDHWSDYRAQQIFRSKELLINFCKKNHQAISNSKTQQKKQFQSINYPQKQPKKQNSSHSKNDSPRSNEKAIKIQQIKKRSISRQVDQISARVGEKNIKNEALISTPLNSNKKTSNNSPYISKVSQTISQQVKTQSRNKQVLGPPKQQFQRKLTKQEYIAYLKNKKEGF